MTSNEKKPLPFIYQFGAGALLSCPSILLAILTNPVGAVAGVSEVGHLPILLLHTLYTDHGCLLQDSGHVSS